jgi:MFS family permease
VAEVFYETLALAAFALLGLWWVVVADRRREWSALPYRRRQAYSVSLYFTLTGIMSLVSLISGKHPELWRLAFGISGALGATELVLSLAYARAEPPRERRIQRLLALTVPLYLLIVAVAIHPTLADDVGIHLKPLESEAIIVSILFFLGINFGWLLFMEPAYPPEPGD